MNLTYTQLCAVTRGVLAVTQAADGFRFHRISARQQDAFARAEEEFRLKADVTSGVRLDFYTDSRTLALGYHGVQSTCSLNYCYFDVWVDGVMALHSGLGDVLTQHEGAFTACLPAGEHRVQVYFPTFCAPVVDYVRLDDGASVRPHVPARQILLHGDSITQGYSALCPSACYANVLARYYDAEIFNQAIGGACFNPEIPETLPGVSPQFILVGYGTNDWAHKTAAAFRRDAEGFMAALRGAYPQTPVFVILPIWRTDAESGPSAAGDFTACRQVIACAASGQGFTVLDNYALLPHDTRLYEDGYLHPSDAGFQVYAKGLCRMLDEALA